MIQITNDFKQKIVGKLLEVRQNFDGTDQQFAKTRDINYSIFSRLKNADNYDGLLKAADWLNPRRTGRYRQ